MKKEGKFIFVFFIIYFSCLGFISSENQITSTLVEVSQETDAYAPIVKVPEDNQLEAIFNSSILDLMKVRVNVNEDISESPILVTKIDETTLDLRTLIGKMYQSFEIQIPEISSENIINTTIEFKISKVWFEENNITVHFKEGRYWLVEENVVGNIKLYKNSEDFQNWISLDTNFFGGDKTSYYFSAYSSGFSTFAIFFNKYDCLPNSIRCEENKAQICLGDSTWLVTETCSNGCIEGKCKNLFFKSDEFFTILITLILGAVAIVLIFLFNKFKKK